MADGTALGSVVEPGQLLATIENVFGETVETFTWNPPDKNKVWKVSNRRPQWPTNAGDTILTMRGVPAARAKVFENKVRDYTYLCSKCTKGN